MTEPEPMDPLADLDPAELREWAGTTTLSRGRHYQRTGRVKDLIRSPAGAIIARVEGTDEYTTMVNYDNGLQSECTCPVGSRCKHAVALILEYQNLLKEHRRIPVMSAGDSRHPHFREIPEDLSESTDSGTRADQSPVTGSNTQKIPVRQQKADHQLHQYLADLPKEELIAILEDLMAGYPRVRQEVSDRKSVAASDAASLYKSLLSDISRISREEAWSNAWSGESRIPDYSPVRKRMEILLGMGKYEDVLKAGELLMKKGIEQVETSDDEGETAMEIARCMEYVFTSLRRSSRPAHERILYAIHAVLDDEYDLCAGADTFLEESFPPGEWGIVADQLLREPGTHGTVPGHDAVTAKFYRDHRIGWIVTALDHAGRDREATDLCIAEVDRTGNYPRLVRRLAGSGRQDEAVTWIRRGVDATAKKYPGIAAELRSIRRELWEKEGDLFHVAGLEAGEFLESPTFLTYQRLEKSARAAGVWEKLEPAVRQVLETGWLPAKRRGSPEGTGTLLCVLPDSGLFCHGHWQVRGQPFFDLLIDISIAHNQPEEVLRWYDRLRDASRARGFFSAPDDRVAGFVAEQFPDRAFAIWKGKAEQSVAEGRPRSYEAAVHYLEKMYGLLKKPDRTQELAPFLLELRATHARKKRFLEMLDSFERKTIRHG
jgi:uncharacterized Zn finger protein